MKTVKLAKFNGELCENLYANIFVLDRSNFDDITNLFNRVSSSLTQKNWLKERDIDYLQNVITEGGFIVGCYVDEILVASALCEVPKDDYLSNLYEIGMTQEEINSTFVCGYVMVDPIYRGNSLHKILLDTRIEESTSRGKSHILTAVAVDNTFSLKTVLDLEFEIHFQKTNNLGITRNIMLKRLNTTSKSIHSTEIIA